jgi:hypothetical protein
MAKNDNKKLTIAAAVVVAIIAIVTFCWAVLDRKLDKEVYAADQKALQEKVSDVKISIEKNEAKDEKTREQVTRIAIKLGVE